jgi:hypothetical protein
VSGEASRVTAIARPWNFIGSLLDAGTVKRGSLLSLR